MARGAGLWPGDSRSFRKLLGPHRPYSWGSERLTWVNLDQPVQRGKH